MHTTGRTYFEAARLIKSKEGSINIEQEVNKRLVAKEEYPLFDLGTVLRLNEQALESERAKSYFQKRKITLESIKKFHLGFSEKQDMVTVPVHSPSGDLVGFVGRSIEGKDFKNTPGLPKSKVLFNIHRVKSADTIYVVESSFDVIRLDQVGIPAVATLGANVSGKQIELLKKYFNDIVVVADNDQAGAAMKERLHKSLKGTVSDLQLNMEYKDIGDMSDDELRNLQVSFDKSIESMLQ